MHKYIVVLKPVDIPKVPKEPEPSADSDASACASTTKEGDTDMPATARFGRVDFKALDRVHAQQPETEFERGVRKKFELEATARSGETERVHAERPQSEFEKKVEARRSKNAYDDESKSEFERELPSSSSPDFHTPYGGGFVPAYKGQDPLYDKRVRMLKEKARREKEEAKLFKLREEIMKREMPEFGALSYHDIRCEWNIEEVARYVKKHIEYLKEAFRNVYKAGLLEEYILQSIADQAPGIRQGKERDWRKFFDFLDTKNMELGREEARA